MVILIGRWNAVAEGVNGMSILDYFQRPLILLKVRMNFIKWNHSH